MNKTTPKLANGVIGLAMLAMLTIAIVAGQARATRGTDVEALPVIVNGLLELPIHIDIDIETGQITATAKAPLDGHE